MRAPPWVLAGLLAACGQPGVGAGGTGRAVEVCDNGADDDGDGKVDCGDPDCRAASDCFRCGDGARQRGESCDGADLGGATCVTLGYERGRLGCSETCELDPSACAYPPENCSAAGDEDRDGVADCADPDCARRQTCLVVDVAVASSGRITERLPVRVRITDGEGLPRGDFPVTVEVPAGAVASPSRPRTDESGVATLELRLGPVPGKQTFRFLLERDLGVSVDVEALPADPGTIVTVAGAEQKKGTDVDGPALAGRIGEPIDLAVDPDGTLYVAEPCRILAVSPAGELSLVAGTGTCGDAGATIRRGDRLTVGGLALHEGALYVASPAPTSAGRIFRIDPSTGAGELVAGGGDLGPEAAEGGPATAMRLDRPGRPRLGSGATLWFADQGLNAVLAVDLAAGTLRTVLRGIDPAGQPAACREPLALLEPRFVIAGDGGQVFVSGRVCGLQTGDPWIDPAGVAPVHEGIVRVDADAELTFLAGRLAGSPPEGDAYAPLVDLGSTPVGAFDAAGNWIGVAGNRVVRVDAVHMGVTTLAGAEEPGFAGELEPASAALLSRPAAVILDARGDAWIADAGNFTVRRVIGAGEATRRRVRFAKEVATPRAYFGESVKVPVFLLDHRDRPLPDREVIASSADPGIRVGDPARADAVGQVEIPVRAGLVEGLATIDVALAGLHGDLTGDAAPLQVSPPVPGTIFTALRYEDLPADPDTWSQGLGPMLVARDRSLYVQHDCRIFRISPLGTAEHVAGNGDCSAVSVDGPARESPLRVESMALDEDAGMLHVAATSSVRPILAVDLGAGTVRGAATSFQGHIAAGPGGALVGVDGTRLLALDLDGGEPEVLLDVGSEACGDGDDRRIRALHGAPLPDGDAYVMRVSFCASPGSYAGVLRWSPESGARMVLGGTSRPPADGVPADEVRLQRLAAIALDPLGRLVAGGGTWLLRVEDGVVRMLSGDDATRPDHVLATESGLADVTDLGHDAAGHLWILDAGAVRVIW